MVLRNRLLFQFFTSEKDYVQQMHTLVNTFLIPMKNLSYLEISCVNANEANSIFGHSELILVLHQTFMKALESRMKQWPAVQIDDFLFTILTAVPVYIEYIKNHPTALKTLAECKKQDSFVKLLMQYEKKLACHGQTLEQFLNYPIRQIPAYIRHIHNILEVTPEGHPEKNPLTKILEKFHEALTYSHFLDEGESIRHTLMIERLIEGGCHLLLTPDQKFIRHGVLKQIAIHSRSERKEILRYCFLFSQHLIISARTDGRRLRLSRHGIIPLNMTTLVEDIDSSNHPDHIKHLAFTLIVRSSDGRSVEPFPVTLRAANSHEKALWTSDISQCIYNLDLEACDDTNNTNSNGEVKADNKDELTHSDLEEERDLVMSLKQPTPYAVSLKEDARLREDDYDIKYGDELAGPYHLPQILYASVDRLIERLSDPRLPGAEFMETFLLTYRAFTDSKVVMKGLIDAYWKVMGGRNTPPEFESSDRNRFPVSGRPLNPNRIRSMISSSSMSSIDDLESSFSSSVFPHSSATVFNYNILKEQLSLPRKRNMETTKWCQDTVIIAKEENIAMRKPRSISACDSRNEFGIDTVIKTIRCNMNRSQSVDIIVTGYKNNGFSTQNRQSTLSSLLRRRRSMDDGISDDKRRSKIYSISQTELHSLHSLHKVNTRSQDDVIQDYCEIKRPGSSITDSVNSLNKYDRTNEIVQSPMFDRMKEETVFDRTNEVHVIGNSSESSFKKKSDTVQTSLFGRTAQDECSTVLDRTIGNINTQNPIFEGVDANTVNPAFGKNAVKELNPYSGRGLLTPLPDVSHDAVPDLRFDTESEREEAHDNDTKTNDLEKSENISPNANLGNVSDVSLDTDGICCGSPLLLGMSVPESIDSSTQPSDEHNNSVSSNHSSGPTTCTCHEKELDHAINIEVSSGDVSVTDVSYSIQSCSPCIEDSSPSFVSHSQSDYRICNSNSDNNVKKSASLDQKKANTSPYFGRRRKVFKKNKLRSVSMPSRDVAVLLNVRHRCSSTLMDRSNSETDKSRLKPSQRSTESTGEELKKSMPISIPGGKVKKTESAPRRKRSIFSKGFLKGPLKRSSSEQVLTVSESLKNQHLRPSASTFNLTDDDKSPPAFTTTRTTTTTSTTNATTATTATARTTTRSTQSAEKNKISGSNKTNIIIHTSKSVNDISNKSASLPTTKSDFHVTKKSPVFPVDFFNEIFSTRKKSKEKSMKQFRQGSVLNRNPVPLQPNVHHATVLTHNHNHYEKRGKRKTSLAEPINLNASPPMQQPLFSKNRGPLKIMSIFKHWVSKHPKDYIEDPELISMVELFFMDIKCDYRTVPVVKEIVKSLERSLAAQRKSMVSAHILDELMLQQGSSADDVDKIKNLTNLKPLHTFNVASVAENMTLLEHYLYAKISFNEFISCQWTKKDKETKAPGIMKFINFFNQVTRMISYNVVFGETAACRARIIEFWIQVASQCRDLNNFNSIMEIVSALNASSVHRMKKSWELVPKTYRDVFNDLHTLVTAERSFKNLREAVHMCNPPCVPYLGCYLSDMLFVHEGGETFNKDYLINFTKMFRITRLVREVKSYQQLPYTLEFNIEVVSSLLKLEKSVNDDILYEQSLLAEPRGT